MVSRGHVCTCMHVFTRMFVHACISCVHAHVRMCLCMYVRVFCDFLSGSGNGSEQNFLCGQTQKPFNPGRPSEPGSERPARLTVLAQLGWGARVGGGDPHAPWGTFAECPAGLHPPAEAAAGASHGDWAPRSLPGTCPAPSSGHSSPHLPSGPASRTCLSELQHPSELPPSPLSPLSPLPSWNDLVSALREGGLLPAVSPSLSDAVSRAPRLSAETLADAASSPPCDPGLTGGRALLDAQGRHPLSGSPQDREGGGFLEASPWGCRDHLGLVLSCSC